MLGYAILAALMSTVFSLDAATNFICPADGDFPVSPGACSSQYISCSNGRAFLRNCASADLRFDIVLKQCLRMDDVKNCHQSGSIPTESNLDCINKPSGPIVNPAEKCSRSKYSCVEGRQWALVTLCPADLYYDITTDRCEHYNDIYVCSGISTSPSPQSDAPTTPKVDFECARKNYGNYADPLNKCVSYFYTCSPIGATITNCAPGTYYDATTDRCDYWRLVLACNSTGTPPAPATTSVYTTVQSDTVTASAFNCQGLVNGNYLAGICLNYFWQCSNGVAFKAQCAAPNLAFSKIKDACIEKSLVAGC